MQHSRLPLGDSCGGHTRHGGCLGAGLAVKDSIISEDGRRGSRYRRRYRIGWTRQLRTTRKRTIGRFQRSEWDEVLTSGGQRATGARSDQRDQESSGREGAVAGEGENVSSETIEKESSGFSARSESPYERLLGIVPVPM